MLHRLSIGAFACALLMCTLNAQALDQVFIAGFDESPEGPYNASEASRFLAQATFGPTPAEIDRLMRIGYHAWLNEQFAMPATPHRPYVAAIDAEIGDQDASQADRTEAFGYRALTAPD